MSQKKIRFNALAQAYKQALVSLPKRQANSNFSRSPLSYQELNQLAKQMIQEFKDLSDEKFWQSYWRLLEKAKSENPGFDYNPIFEKEHINFAIRNAFYGYFGLIALVPRLYKKQFHREIDPNEYYKACLGTRSLIYHLSKFHFDVFRAFIYATANISEGVNSNLHVFDTKFFDFNEALEMQLNTEARAAIKAQTEKLAQRNKLRIEEPTLGCPALLVLDESGNDLIDLCFDWSLNSLGLQSV